MEKLKYSDIYEDVAGLAAKIQTEERGITSLYGVPRGGVVVATLLSPYLELPLVDEPEATSLVVDDLVDSGETIKRYSDYMTATLYNKSKDIKPTFVGKDKAADAWIEFPWEETDKDVEDSFRRILQYLGEDPTREGLQETPKRYIRFLEQFLKKEEFNFTTFENEGTDQMIIQKGIPFFSLCEHHVAPFFGEATVAYIPGKQIVGLSKLARTVQHYSHNLQNQERITSSVAERLSKELGDAQGVAVTLSARHFCMEMRGVKTMGAYTVTTKLLGAFKDDDKARAEYMAQVTK